MSIYFGRFDSEMSNLKKTHTNIHTQPTQFNINFLWKFSFLKFYDMGSTGFDFGGIVHRKVGVIANQKI